MKHTFLLILIGLIIHPSYSIYHKIGHFENDDQRIISIAANEQIAVTAKYLGLIEILDIENLDQIFVLDSIQINIESFNFIKNIHLIDNFLFIVKSKEVLYVNIDETPFAIDTIKAEANDFTFNENNIFITTNDSLKIFELKDEKVEFLNGIGGEFGKITYQENYIYSAHENIFKIIDISDLNNLFLTYTHEEQAYHSFKSIDIIDHNLIIDNNNKLFMYDISDPYNPYFIEEFNPNTNISNLNVANNTLFSASSDGLFSFKLNENGFLEHLSFFDCRGSANDMVLINNLAFLSCGYYGMQIINIENPDDNFVLNTVDTDAGCIALKNNLAYIAHDQGGYVQIFDISDETDIKLLGSNFLDRIGDASELSIHSNKIVFTLRYPYPEVIFADLTDPLDPQMSFAFKLEDFMIMSTALNINDSYAVIGGNDSIFIFDIQDIQHPILSFKTITSARVNDVLIIEDKLVSIQNNGELLIYDFLKGILTEVNTINLGGNPWEFIKKDDFLYIANYEEGIQIVDISNITTPNIISQIKPSNPYTFSFHRPLIFNNKLVFSDFNWNKTYTYNISNPYEPVFLFSTKTNFPINTLSYHNESIWAGCSEFGLKILDTESLTLIEEEEKNTEKNHISIFPNPFHKQVIFNINPEINELYIYDMSSQLIKTIKTNNRSEIIWNGINENGNTVQPGLYFVKSNQQKIQFKQIIKI